MASLSDILSWINEPEPGAESGVAESLNLQWLQNSELAEQFARLPWLSDGVDPLERDVLEGLQKAGRAASALAEELMAHSWVTDDLTEIEEESLKELREITLVDVGLAKELAALPWFADGATRLEISAIYSLDDIASKDEGLVREILSWPRFEGGVTRDLDFFLLYALAEVDSQLLNTATTQHWFTDGLEDKEAALIVTLSGKSKDLFSDLLKLDSLHHFSATLPLAGEVNIWVVQGVHPAPISEVVKQVEDTGRVAEGFFGIPFPTSDIIVLVGAERVAYGQVVAHHGSHMSISIIDGKQNPLPHETAHYYLHNNFSQAWLNEGGANFIRTLFRHDRGEDNLEDRSAWASSGVEHGCNDYGVESLRPRDYLAAQKRIQDLACAYLMGESFLLSLLNAMGKRAMSSALKEMYLDSGGYLPHLGVITPPSEEEIFEAFMRRTSAEGQEEVRELFQRLHGGDFAFPEIDYDDAEADRPTEPAGVEVGEVVGGSLDYVFDFDFFRFEAKGGQQYRFSVEHSTLGQSSIALFGPNGLSERREGWRGRQRGPDGPLLLWQAPSSEVYYFAVQNFGGKRGDYTFTIEPVGSPAEADGHRDTPESATEVRAGLRVSGYIDHFNDYDYFRFSAREGEELSFSFYGDFLNSLCSQVYHADGSTTENWPNLCELADPPEYRERYGINWWAPQTGEYYLALYGMVDMVGEYEFAINQSG